MNAISRRGLFGSVSASAAGACALELAASRRPSPSGALLDLTRAFRDVEIEFDLLDSQDPRAPEGSSEAIAFERAYVDAEHRRFDLHDAPFYRRPTTLADAAVLAGHALAKLDCTRNNDLRHSLDSGHLERELLEMQNAFAGILSVVAPAAGIDPRDISWRDMHETFSSTLAELEE